MQTSLKLYEYIQNIPKTVPDKIILTDIEEKIFSFLLSNNQTNTTFRVAGGWVRDKLLNLPSTDLDITLDNISGQDFKEILIKNNSSIIKEKKNSNSKSSHLHTATINLFNLDIDLNNLRKEIYHPNNRVPEISKGTPLEDALRRDITINTLFYNINNKTIEDFTKNGINDLKNGIINMPKSPEISFNEDPLRMIRVIRFATRFQFKINNEIIEAFNEKNLNLFGKIISNERIEKELSLIMEKKYSYASVFLLFKLGLLKYILKFEDEKIFINNEDLINCVNIILISNYLINYNDNNNFFIPEINYDNNNNNKILNYSLFTTPLRKYEFVNKKNIKEIGSKIYLNKVLKLNNNLVNEIINLIFPIHDIQKIIKNNNFNRLEIGLLMKNIKFKNFKKILFICVCDEYINNENNIIEYINIEKINKILFNYKQFYDYVINEKSENTFELKPIIDGKTLKKELNLNNNQIGKFLNILIEEQIKNPLINKEEAINILKNKIN